MPAQPSIDAIEDWVIDELARDWVGLWLICKWGRVDEEERWDTSLDRAIQVTDGLLRRGVAVPGQFDQSGFHEWSGEVDAWMARIRSEARALGRLPDIGEVVWLSSRDEDMHVLQRGPAA